MRVGIKADADGTAVANVKRAGAIPIAVTNTPELCASVETFNFVTGYTANPHDLSRSSGGSSGGEVSGPRPPPYRNARLTRRLDFAKQKQKKKGQMKRIREYLPPYTVYIHVYKGKTKLIRTSIICRVPRLHKL